MKEDLKNDNKLYRILNKYLSHFNNRINKVKDKILHISENVKLYNKKIQSAEITQEDKEKIQILQDDFLKLSTEKKKLDKNLRKITEFNVDLALNQIKKEDPMFEKMMNHFLESENYEYCELLNEILNKYFDDEEKGSKSK